MTAFCIVMLTAGKHLAVKTRPTLNPTRCFAALNMTAFCIVMLTAGKHLAVAMGMVMLTA